MLRFKRLRRFNQCAAAVTQCNPSLGLFLIGLSDNSWADPEPHFLCPYIGTNDTVGETLATFPLLSPFSKGDSFI